MDGWTRFTQFTVCVLVVSWDVFSLDYAVSTPLNVIFTPDAMQQYLRIFQLLWK